MYTRPGEARAGLPLQDVAVGVAMGDLLPGQVRLGKLTYTPTAVVVEWFMDWLPRESIRLKRAADTAHLLLTRAREAHAAGPNTKSRMDLLYAEMEAEQADRLLRGHQELMDAAAGWYMRRAVKRVEGIQCHNRF